ncbi:MAG: sterol desaturase family protein [Flavobacteriales bacterium]|nr:sterol desaturase family protein [Flavobacteriales bacterium]
MEAYFFIWLKVFVIVTLRYLFFASLVFFPCYFWFKNSIAWRRIQAKFPVRKDYQREIGYSLLTFVFFGLSGLLVFVIKDHTQLYANISDYPIWWFVLSIPVALVIHDTYFYWTHRLMHHPKLFKAFHLVHHKSTNPTPWASFAFHPLEAMVESGIIIVLAFIIPMHLYALMLFLVVMTMENVMGHLGYEFFPKWLTRSKLGFWLNTSTNHNMHHKYFDGNYGLYFRWWDEWMGTTHAKYTATLEEIQNRKPSEQKKRICEAELA